MTDPVELMSQAAHDRFFDEFCRIVDARVELERVAAEHIVEEEEAA
jgi:hypothetical protein